MNFAFSIIFLAYLSFLQSPAHAEGYVTKGVKKGVEETKYGVNKGVEETKFGVKKGVDYTVGGTKKGIKETKKFFKKNILMFSPPI